MPYCPTFRANRATPIDQHLASTLAAWRDATLDRPAPALSASSPGSPARNDWSYPVAGDQAALGLFLSLLQDPVPEVRFLAAHELWWLADRTPQEFWAAIKERASLEVNDIV